MTPWACKFEKKNLEITWACQFESAPEVEGQMKELFGGFYHVIIEGLEGHINS